jgi:OOP family OmpA-OmpF porin
MFRRALLVPFLIFAFSTTAMAEGFYAGAGLGLLQIEDEEEGISFEDNPLGWRLLAGYDVNENFAIEGSYVNSGEAEDEVLGEQVEVKLTAFTVSVVGLMPVSDTVKLFGKLGFYTGEEEVTVQGFTLDDDDDGMTVGAGIRFASSDNLVIRGDFDWFDTQLDTVWSVGVGIQYYFGQ